MSGLSRYFRVTRTSLAILFAVPLLVFGWHWVFGGETAHQREIVADYGTVKKIVGVPRPNHAGTKLVYGQQSEKGLQVYLYNFRTGENKLLFEQSAQDFKEWNFKIIGWSPDDKYFAYYRLPGENKAFQVVICDGDTGAEVGTVPINPIIAGTWVSSQAIVCMGNENDGTLYETRRESNGTWSRALYYFKSPVRPGFTKNVYMEGLTGYKGNTVVWAQAGVIWICDPETAAPKKFLQLTNSDIINFAYSPQTGKFLLYRSDQDDDVLSFYDPDTGKLSDLEIISHTTGTTTAIQWYFNKIKLAWINGGDGYAYVTRDFADHDWLVIKKTASSEPVKLLWPDQVHALSASDQQLFVVGSTNNEPTGIWEYDLANGSLASVIPNLAHPFKYTTLVSPSHTVITNKYGMWGWNLYAPVHFSPDKKYPALISAFGSPEGYAQTVANCGMYYVSCDLLFNACPPGLFDVFYENLTNNPNINPKRLFLMSSSGDNYALYRLVEANPSRFRGAVLLSPVSYPDPKSIANMKILVDGARDDPYTNGLAMLPKFQDKALLAGVPVSAVIHAVGGHGDTLWMASSDRQRLSQIIEFVSEP